MLGKSQKEQIARRLDNWVRWRKGGAGASVSPYPAYRLCIEGVMGKSDGGIPILVGEAEDTDHVLRGMNPDLVKPLTEHYLRRGTPHEKAKRCKLLVRTFHRRVAEAELVFYRLVFRPRRTPWAEPARRVSVALDEKKLAA